MFLTTSVIVLFSGLTISTTNVNDTNEQSQEQLIISQQEVAAIVKQNVKTNVELEGFKLTLPKFDFQSAMIVAENRKTRRNAASLIVRNEKQADADE